MEARRDVHEAAKDGLGKAKGIKVLYHADCDDGFGAAWACYRFFKSQHILSNVEFLPVKYNEPPPEMHEQDTVFIVDFSYRRAVTQGIHALVDNLIILDHHKTAEKELEGLPYCVFDMKRSGAMITWNYFFKEPAPKLIQYVQDNDIWTKKLLHTSEVTRYIRSYPMDFGVWDTLHEKFEKNLHEVFAEAEAVERFFRTTLEFTLNTTAERIMLLDGHRCPIANLPRMFSGEGCHEMLRRYEADVALSYFFDDNLQAIVSLRSTDEVDCSAIAKKYGGGGHAKASGFEMNPQKLFELFYTNTPMY